MSISGLGPKCNFCSIEQKSKSILNCGACQKVIYCDRECQKKDWRSHRTICQVNTIQTKKLPLNEFILELDNLIKQNNEILKTKNKYLKHLNGEVSSPIVSNFLVTILNERVSKTMSSLEKSLNLYGEIPSQISAILDPYLNESDKIFKIFLEMKEVFPSSISKLNRDNFDFFIKLVGKYFDWMKKTVVFFKKYENESKVDDRWRLILKYMEVIKTEWIINKTT